jgi:signal transduction histidine kinase
VPGRAAFLTPVGWALLTGVVLVAGVGAERVAGPGMPDAVGDLVAGLALLVGGAAAWVQRPGSRCGPLSVLAGAAWFAGDLAEVLLYAHRGPLVQLLLTYPSGRVGSRAAAAVIGAAYVDGLVPELARSEWPTIALMAAVTTVAAWRHRTVGGVERRARAAALAGAVMIGGTLALAASARLAGADLDTAATWAYYVAVAVTAVGLAADLLWGRWTRAAVTGLVVDLGDRLEPGALRTALARTLGDPDVELAYRVAGADIWVDETGRAVRLPEADGRAVTLVHDDGAAIAALIHDPAALADRELVASVAAAARLAVVNVRLQAEIAARIGEVTASRRRLVEARDDERRRLGEALHAGAENRLADLRERLFRLAAQRDRETGVILGRLAEDLEAARAEVVRFAQGIHPHSLADGGLHAALHELAGQTAVPVRLDVSRARFPPAQEAAAFFLCSEGLANVAKYAEGATVDIAVQATASGLVVSVTDDGAGGADPARGSGLRGLADRVEALGGALRVDSRTGAGTRLVAELPISGGEST